MLINLTCEHVDEPRIHIEEVYCSKLHLFDKLYFTRLGYNYILFDLMNMLINQTFVIIYCSRHEYQCYPYVQVQ